MARRKTYRSAAGEAPAGARKAFLKAIAADFDRALSPSDDSPAGDLSDKEYADLLGVVRVVFAGNESEDAEQVGKAKAA